LRCSIGPGLNMTRDTLIDAALPEPEGFTAISRWLSGATPPGTAGTSVRIPEGCQQERCVRPSTHGSTIPKGLRSLRDRGVRLRVLRGCRSAQPLADSWQAKGWRRGCDPSGIGVFACAGPRGCRFARPPANSWHPCRDGRGDDWCPRGGELDATGTRYGE
jgi:hypothetical protein